MMFKHVVALPSVALLSVSDDPAIAAAQREMLLREKARNLWPMTVGLAIGSASPPDPATDGATGLWLWHRNRRASNVYS